MRILVCLLFSLYFCGDLIAQDKTNQQGQNNKDCETRRVINETSGSVHVITTCIDNAPIKEEAGESNQGISNDLGKTFRKFNDLDAQVSMAHSTFWIKWLTLVGVVVGGIGLWLLGKTLGETRSASSYARETLMQTQHALHQAELTTEAANRSADVAESAERAHLIIVFDCEEIADERGLHRFWAEVRNVGKTPALNVETNHSWNTGRRACLAESIVPIQYIASGSSEEIAIGSFKRLPSSEQEEVIARIKVSIIGYRDIYGVGHSGLTADGELLNCMSIRSEVNLAVSNTG